MNSILVILTLVNAISAREIIQVFESHKSPFGTFYSKGFPYSYNPTEVEVFEFRGHEDEKVQITFNEFNLFSKSTNERCGIDGSFISYKKTEKSSRPEEFCGNHKPLPIMSEDNHFRLLYEAIVVPSNSPTREQNEKIGFNATYRFVKNFGIDYSLPQSEYLCDFTYDSEIFPSGTFSSPNFPGMFPGYIQCYYTFRGIESNIVFTFTQFNLLGSDDCDAELEKKDKLQILITVDGIGQPEDNKKQFCGNRTTPFNVTITNSTAFIIFSHQTTYSDYELAKYDFVGFNASFLFTNDTAKGTSDRRLPDIISICVCFYLVLNQRLLF